MGIRRSSVSGLVLALALGGAQGCARELRPCGGGQGRAPSFIVIVADTLRADFVSRSSGEASLTPALDAFAGEAVSFSRTFSQAPWTTPSVASLLTGLHPRVHGLVTGSKGEAGVLSEQNETLPETLAGAGYDTTAFVANQWLMPGYGFEQGFDTYEFIRRGQVGNVFARATRWLGERDSTRPYLLYLHLMEVHGPYTAPEPFVENARAALTDLETRALSAEDFGKIPEYMLRYPWTREERARDLREWRTRYGAGVAAFDATFGRFMEIAKEQDWLRDAVVVVTSDHGEELLDHGHWGHGETFFDELLHVPLMVRLPGARNGGREVETLSSLIDLRPTLLSLAGLADDPDTPATHRGRDRSPELCADAPAPKPDAELSFATASRHPDTWSVRTPGFKLVHDARSRSSELFDLARDPEEQSDVSHLHPERARRLEARLLEHVSSVTRGARRPETAPVAPAVQSQLEALGYVDPEPGA